MPRKIKGLYLRPDGIYEKVVTENGTRYPFRSSDPDEVWRKYYDWREGKETTPFEAVANEWWEPYSQTVKLGTIRSFRPCKNRAVEYFKKTPIQDIELPDVNAYIIWLAAKDYASKTVSNHLSVLSMVFVYAIGKGLRRDNPCAYAKIPARLPKRKIEPPTPEQVAVAAGCHAEEFGLLPFFLLHTGARIGEALAVQYKDIDDKFIYINKEITYSGSTPILDTTKTAKGVRKIVLLPQLKAILPDGAAEHYVFGGSEPLKRSYYTKQWVQFWKRHNMAHQVKWVDRENVKRSEWRADVNPHQFRHAYASLILRAGVDEKVAQILLGHADIATTRNIYQHILDSQLEDAAGAIERQLLKENTQ